MGLREDLLKRIDKKAQEIRELELQIREANSYIQGIQDVLRMLPKEGSGEKKSGHVLRPNSDMAKARDFLMKIGSPAYIGEILDGIGKGDTKANRLSLSGSLGDYVRKGEIFTRPAPNTFGLVEFEDEKTNETATETSVTLNETPNRDDVESKILNEPPDDFGITHTSGMPDNHADESDPFGDE